MLVKQPPDTQWYSQVAATHLKIGHLYRKSMHGQTSNELLWLDGKIGHQDSSPVMAKVTCPIILHWSGAPPTHGISIEFKIW